MALKVNNIDSNGNSEVTFAKPIVATAASTSTQLVTKGQLDTATSGFRPFVPVRQVVFAGSVDTAGIANFLSIAGTGVQLDATTDNVRATWAAGNDIDGPINYIYEWTADTAPANWDGLADGTHFLYIDYNGGTPTYGATTLQPVYDTVAPSGPSTDQAWFDTNNYIMYVFNGSLWIATERLFVGSAIFSGGSPTTVYTFAINGRYDSRWFIVAAATNYTKYHNIGVKLAEGVNTTFYYSLDSAGADSSIAHDFTSDTGTSTQFIGHLNREDVANSGAHLYIKFGFAVYTQYYRSVLRTTGYYRIVAQRMF